MDDAAKAELFFHIHRCPTTNRVILSEKNDDKALCNCGVTNPRVAEAGRTEAPGTHIKAFLRWATGHDFIEQRNLDRKTKGS